MKRHELEAHLRAQGCYLLREGGKHSVWVNSLNHRTSTIPRHREIDRFLVRKICRDLLVPPP